MILGFTVAHIGMCLICLGCIMPRYYDVLIPPHRRGEGTEATVVLELKDQLYARDPSIDVPNGSKEGSSKAKSTVKSPAAV
jgi:solute carrier family 6 (neurotransmitter transporter, GABA) member 1